MLWGLFHLSFTAHSVIRKPLTNTHTPKDTDSDLDADNAIKLSSIWKKNNIFSTIIPIISISKKFEFYSIKLFGYGKKSHAEVKSKYSELNIICF